MSIHNPRWNELLHRILIEEPIPTVTNMDGLLADGQLLAVVEAVRAGEPPDRLVDELYQQLGDDDQALEELAAVLALFRTDEEAAMVEPISEPRYTLDFLPKPRGSSALSTIPAQVRAQWQAGHAWVREQMGTVWVDAAHHWLGQPPQLAMTTRSRQPLEEADGNTLYQLSLGSEELTDLDLEIRALRTTDPTLCDLLITARIPSRWPFLAGVEVLLLGSEPQRQALTDDDGLVQFSQFPVADLAAVVVKINPPLA